MNRIFVLVALSTVLVAGRSYACGAGNVCQAFNDSPALNAVGAVVVAVPISLSLAVLALDTVTLVQLAKGVPRTRSVLITTLALSLVGAFADALGLLSTTRPEHSAASVAFGTALGVNVASVLLSSVLLAFPNDGVRIAPSVSSSGAGASLSFRF